MNKSYKIIIYTSDNCSFCHSAKEIFKEKKLKFEEINISKDDKLKNEMIKNGMVRNFINYALNLSSEIIFSGSTQNCLRLGSRW